MKKIIGVRFKRLGKIYFFDPKWLEVKKGENVMIVNMEEKTTVTTILNQRVYSVDTIPNGMQEIIEKINGGSLNG